MQVTSDKNKSGKGKGKGRGGRKPPPRPGNGASASSSDDSTEDGDGDGDGGGTEPTATVKQPAHIRKASVFRRLGDRLKLAVHGKPAEGSGRGSVEMDGWIDDPDLNAAKEKADAAVASLYAAADLLEAKGTDFTPVEKKARGGRSRKIAKGTKMRMRDKQRKNYEDLLTAEELDNLTVQDHRGAKVVLLTPDGGRLFLPRGHVEIVDEEDTEDAAE